MDFIDAKYNDVSEISIFLYNNLLRLRTNMYESILLVIEKYDSRKKKIEDYYEKSSVINHCYESIASELLKIIVEMFEGG